jgi:hypothetical protein
MQIGADPGSNLRGAKCANWRRLSCLRKSQSLFKLFFFKIEDETPVYKIHMAFFINLYSIKDGQRAYIK